VVGLSEDLTGRHRDAREAAKAAFGRARAVVRAGRRPAAAVLAQAGLAALRLAAVYLLAVSAAGVSVLVVRTTLIRLAATPGTEVVAAPVDYARTFGVLAVAAIAGLTLLAGCRLAGRQRAGSTRRPGGPGSRALLGGCFPLAAVVCMLTAVLVVRPLLRTVRLPGAAFAAVPGLPALTTLGAAAVALGYAVQMAWILLRQHDTGERVPHAG
jgi:hypothetical protein